MIENNSTARILNRHLHAFPLALSKCPVFGLKVLISHELVFRFGSANCSLRFVTAQLVNLFDFGRTVTPSIYFKLHQVLISGFGAMIVIH